MILSCKLCGMDFEADSRKRRYCDACREACAENTRRERNCKRLQQYYATKCQERVKKPFTLAECAREADRMGMTYGQYMAKRRNQSD